MIRSQSVTTISESKGKSIPRIPRYRIDEIRADRTALEQAAYGFENVEIGWSSCYDLISAWSDILKASTVAIWGSFQPFVGEPFSTRLISKLAWRLAGNKPDLRKGISPLPWAAKSVTPQWVLLQAAAVYPKKVFERNGSEILWRVWTGRPAGEVVRRFWSKEYFHFSKASLGLKSAPYAEYLVGAFLYALLTAEDCRNGKIGFSQIRVTKGLRDRNSSLLRARTRTYSPCPQGRSIPCHRCPIGYDSCPLALHPKTFLKQTCERCRRHTWIDPDRSRTICVGCVYREMFGGG